MKKFLVSLVFASSINGFSQGGMHHPVLDQLECLENSDLYADDSLFYPGEYADTFLLNWEFYINQDPAPLMGNRTVVWLQHQTYLDVLEEELNKVGQARLDLYGAFDVTCQDYQCVGLQNFLDKLDVLVEINETVGEAFANLVEGLEEQQYPPFPFVVDLLAPFNFGCRLSDVYL